MKNVRWVGFMTWAASMIVPFAAPAAESELWWGLAAARPGQAWPSEGARPLSGVRARTSAGSVSCRARGLRRRQSGAISCTFRRQFLQAASPVKAFGDRAARQIKSLGGSRIRLPTAGPAESEAGESRPPR